MKYNSKKELRVAILIFSLLFVFGVSIPLIVDIGNQMENSASKNLLNATYVIENSVNTKVQNDLNALLHFAELDMELNPENLRVLCKSGGFFQINRIETDGIGYNCEGERVRLDDIGNNWSVLGDGKPGISQCYYGANGRKAIAFGVPLLRNGKVMGALYAEREVEAYYSDSAFSFYEGMGRGYLVEAQTGEFELKTLKSDGLSIAVSNLYGNLKESKNNVKVVRQVESAIAEGKTGTAQVRYDGKESYICFTPVAANPHWYLVTIIGKTNLMAESVAVRRTIVFMLVIVVTGLVVTFGTVFAVSVKSRKEAERKKRAALFESITSTVEHAFVVYDPAERKVEYASENMERLFGLDSCRVRQNINIVFEWLNIPVEDERRGQFVAGSIAAHYERESCISEGERTRWIRSEVSPSEDGKYITVLTDVTREKEYAQTLSMAMQNAENANRAKSEFLSNMSHDIRTPMNGIIGMTAIAAANVGDKEKVKDCLRKISDASAYLMGLINEVLDMSRIESGKASLHEEPCNLADFMYNLVRVNHAAIEQKNQNLAMYVAEVRHETVLADRIKLQQVMTNIISNANKYTPEGGKIQISLTEKPANSKGYGCYEFICRDNGIGMSEEFVQKIFDPFERDKHVVSRGVQGTGLGMSIVKNIVDMMGGIIRVRSVLEQGTEIAVIVNLRLQNAQQEEEKLPALPVLVVDDDKLCCIHTVAMLQDIGMNGEWVLTGNEAVEKCVQAHARAADYFSVILDWRMPGMDGIETARQIRAKVGKDIPIIILTAYNYEQVEEEAKLAGVTAFLPKPLFRNKLYSKLKHLFENGQENEADRLEATRAADFRGRRFLLVEDNALNLEIAVNMLKSVEVEIETASDGKEGLEKYLAMPANYYDLVLMDIQMPVMNGYEATRAIRRSGRADAQTLPILAMTANAFTEDEERAREAGMNGHIAKPIDVEKMIGILQEQLEERACLGK